MMEGDPPVDLSYLAEQIGDYQAAVQIAIRYHHHLTNQIARLERAVQTNERELVHRIAHSIRGSCINLIVFLEA